MKVAIHQPNYLPWIGFFDKLDQVDKFVLLDTAFYSKTSYVNRNSIKTPEGKYLLTVPLRVKNQPINKTIIDYTSNWNIRHWKIIESNYKNSTFWNEYKEGFYRIYDEEWKVISTLNIALIRYISKILNINTELVMESELYQDFGRGNTRNMNIVKYLQGSTYLSGTGAKVYNDGDEFNKNGILLEYQQFNHPHYPQRWGSFIPNLSIIDMIFNCGPETGKLIRKYRRKEHE